MTTRRNDASAAGSGHSPTHSPSASHESSSQGVLTVMWQYKVIIAAITLAFTATATVLAFVAEDKYQASITLSPVTDDSSGGRLGGLSSLASQFGGVFGISSPGTTQKQETLATLQSEALTERYISENNLLPILYDGKWDSVKRRWKELPPDDVPTLWKSNQFFRRQVRSISNDTKTGLTTMKISWKDPNVAAKWANGLVKLTNDYLRNKAIQESERNIAYLKDQLSKTNIIGVQSAINSILENEMKKAMLAQGSQEYALKVIDPAVPPEKRFSPIRSLWISTGFLLGLIGSTVIAFVYRFRPIRLYLNQVSPER